MSRDEDIESMTESGMIGIGWATSGGEATALFNDEYLAADGIENVINVLEYCVSQDLKKDLYRPSEKLYNFNVVRLVDDKPDANWENDGAKYHESLKNVIMQFVLDSVKRNS